MTQIGGTSEERRGDRARQSDAGHAPVASTRSGSTADAIVFFRMGDFYEMFYEDALRGRRARSTSR